ncbi:MAG: class I SAM-dependent methyltransferase [Bryobacterales bacterium]|nr:class I SAM-dependent methyltransferase [Bryobacterales bacterium]MEB2361568.1 class I SAM-dependent methyltransferase [Bryobacterales bacterium]
MKDRTPNRPPVAAHLRYQAEAERFRGLTLEQTFTRIYETNLWGSESSRSGSGSAESETATLCVQIPKLLKGIGVRSLLDIPCGDFGWLSQTDLAGIDYTGADIVAELVANNTARYGSPSRRFCHLDLTRDILPRADVVLCRDCLVHLSFENIFHALANLRNSRSIYLLTTTFTDHDVNQDAANGDWRMLNLERAPFHFPPALALVVEGCSEGGGAYADKSLGLWRLQDLPE